MFVVLYNRLHICQFLRWNNEGRRGHRQYILHVGRGLEAPLVILNRPAEHSKSLVDSVVIFKKACHLSCRRIESVYLDKREILLKGSSRLTGRRSRQSKEYKTLVSIEATSIYYCQAGISVKQGLVPVISVDSIHGSSGEVVVRMSVHDVRGCGIGDNANKPTCCFDKGLQMLLRRIRKN